MGVSNIDSGSMIVRYLYNNQDMVGKKTWGEVGQQFHHDVKEGGLDPNTLPAYDKDMGAWAVKKGLVTAAQNDATLAQIQRSGQEVYKAPDQNKPVIAPISTAPFDLAKKGFDWWKKLGTESPSSNAASSSPPEEARLKTPFVASDRPGHVMVTRQSVADYAPAAVDLNLDKTANDKIKTSWDFFEQSGLGDSKKPADVKLFDDFMRGDQNAARQIEQKMAGQRSPEGQQWAKDTMAELYQNRQQWQEAMKSEGGAGPAAAAPQLAATGPVMKAPGQ